MFDLIKAYSGIIALVLVVLSFGFLVGNEETEEILGSNITTFTNPIVFSGTVKTAEFTQGGGILQFTATATQAARTVTAAELAAYNVIEIVQTASPALSLTLPATSTLTAVIPNAGDFREWIIDNQHLAATTTTIVAGTGIDLIAVTVNDDVIDGVEKSRLTCWRKYNTDVACIVSELLAAD